MYHFLFFRKLKKINKNYKYHHQVFIFFLFFILFGFMFYFFFIVLVCPRGLQTLINRIVRPVHGNL